MQASRVRSALRRQGMTLIEIMIVVVIMGLVTAAIGIGVVNAKKTADLGLAKATLRSLAQISEAYQMTHGTQSECPTMAQLEASKLIRAGSSTEDPWGSSYELSCETGEVDVRSLGPDRERGTADDLTLLDPPPD